VQKCTNEGTEQFTVKEKKEWTDIPVYAAVCPDHLEQLGKLETEWLYELSKDPVSGQMEPSLIVGDGLQGLNEYILTAAPDTVTYYTTTARVFSHPEHHNGHHVPLHVRRRGGDYQEITLVIPFDKLPGLVDLLKSVMPRD
jgi:hypothetical protein